MGSEMSDSMSASHRAICNDFYVNLKLGVKLELSQSRHTLLEFFEQLRRGTPSLSNLRRFKDELSLETGKDESPHRWVAVRPQCVRAGAVNPSSLEEAYELHRSVLRAVPYFLSVSPIDVDFVELLYGFDLECGRHHDAVIFDALLDGSPLSRVVSIGGGSPLDCQPVLGCALDPAGKFEAQFEIKSRSDAGDADPEGSGEPISVYCTVRRTGTVDSHEALAEVISELAEMAEPVVEQRVVPNLLVPLREAIVGS